MADRIVLGLVTCFVCAVAYAAIRQPNEFVEAVVVLAALSALMYLIRWITGMGGGGSNPDDWGGPGTQVGS